ncbi:MAG: alpha-galactosidase [Ruminococcus sp.]|jgi:alpha-galactosidase
MSIFFEEKSGTFHLTNGMISYIIKILPNRHLGHLFFGKAVNHRDNYDYLLEMVRRSMTAYVYPGDLRFSMEHIKQEYPSYGSGDFREPAVRILQKNGSSITDFVFDSYRVEKGKPKLEGLPATYCESDDEAETLIITVKDEVTEIKIELLYSIFTDIPAISRSARFVNTGTDSVYIKDAMSLSLDFPDCNYEWVQLSGAWCRERYIISTPLRPGVQSVGSVRGTSSHNHNPFVILKRPEATEKNGEAIGFSLVYSGNFLARAEVDHYDVTRLTLGIHPLNFCWKLEPEQRFQTPEAVAVYSEEGLNGMSQVFHKLYRERLARGYWRDRPRPILINNWEATGFDFTEEKLLHIAETAKKQGIEMFVLDDGWYGDRVDDTSGLGDWYPNLQRLQDGIHGLAEKIEALGMKFGLWIEPEMVNMNSNLYRAHPDWVIHTPGRKLCHGRNQYVLDYSRKEVVDYIYEVLAKLLREAKISYIKWDMNRCMTEPYSEALPADRQGEIMHRYILGVYDLYERLTSEFPYVLFESCASGGGRFDPGILYYAPQGWVSDDTDAAERMKIQYGTSLCYPISCMGAHVSAVPNQQAHRITPLRTRANVACFGTFGYELDLNQLSKEELALVSRQVEFMKKYRRILQFGTFYRLESPFESNHMSWMCVNEEKDVAIVGYYKFLNGVNLPFTRIRLMGLNPDKIYSVNEKADYYGSELMNIGLITSDGSTGEETDDNPPSCDFDSRLYVLKAK